MRRVIGLDIHRTFAEAVAWDDGRLIRLGRLDMTRTGLEGFGKSLRPSDEVVVEATGNAMAVVRVLSPFVARVIVANPLQVKAIAHAHVKTDKIDAGVLASLHAAGFLPEVWTPDPETERLRRLVARRNQVVRHRTRIKNEVHAILHAHLIPRCPHADLFNRRGRDWLSRQPLPVDEKATIDRHVRELDRLGGGSGRARPGGGARRNRQSVDRATDHNHRGQPHGRGRACRSHRRYPPLREPTPTHVFYVLNGESVVAQVTQNSTNGDRLTTYLHSDNLTSIDATHGPYSSTTTTSPALSRAKKSGPPSATEFAGSAERPMGRAHRRRELPHSPRPPVAVSVGFTGHEEDSELGLINMQGRIYDARLGRFLQADPVLSFAVFQPGIQPIRPTYSTTPCAS